MKLALSIAAITLAAAGTIVPAAANTGIASFYGRELAGNRTASGERFNPAGLTAAHRSLPLGTRLRVTNLANGRTVMVRVNDRGPFVRNRVLDLSQGAARVLGFVASGTARVRFERVGAMAETSTADARITSASPRISPENAMVPDATRLRMEVPNGN